MKTILYSLLFTFLSVSVFSQSEELYKLYRFHEYEKCLKKCDALLEKDIDNLDAYWIKALIYYEMAQNPEKWIEITDDPLQESLRNLARIRVKDDDKSYLESKTDTIVMIKEMAEEYAREYRESGRKNSAVKLYKLMFRAFQGQEDALQLAQIYIMADDYMQCIMQIDKIYSSASPDVIPANTDDSKALLDGMSFMIRNFMFKDAFIMIDKYREKFKSNPYLISSFKKAVYLAVDTLYTNKDKTLFFEYAQRGKNFYGSDPEYLKHLESLCVRLIKDSEDTYKATDPATRTWRDTAHLRDAFKYADMALLLLPENATITKIEDNMTIRHHAQIPQNKSHLFIKYALEIINEYRNDGCFCDSGGQVPSIDSLKWNATLAYLAAEHAKDMFAYNYISSVNRRGLDTKGRIDETELKGTKMQTMGGMNFVGALSVGENLGYGVSLKDVHTDEDYKTAIATMVSKWILAKTGGSCERIMDYEFTDFGLGMFGDKWVLLFANVLHINDR